MCKYTIIPTEGAGDGYAAGTMVQPVEHMKKLNKVHIVQV